MSLWVSTPTGFRRRRPRPCSRPGLDHLLEGGAGGDAGADEDRRLADQVGERGGHRLLLGGALGELHLQLLPRLAHQAGDVAGAEDLEARAELLEAQEVGRRELEAVGVLDRHVAVGGRPPGRDGADREAFAGAQGEGGIFGDRDRAHLAGLHLAAIDDVEEARRAVFGDQDLGLGGVEGRGQPLAEKAQGVGLHAVEGAWRRRKSRWVRIRVSEAVVSMGGAGDGQKPESTLPMPRRHDLAQKTLLEVGSLRAQHCRGGGARPGSATIARSSCSPIFPSLPGPAMTESLLPAVEILTGPAPTHAVIWLHGLGADGHDFEPVVDEFDADRLPPTRFIFPHAPKRAVTINGGYVMRAWFDIYSRDYGNRAEDVEGTEASAAQVEALIARENARGIPTSASCWRASPRAGRSPSTPACATRTGWPG
jgi:hypothetical protein